jgi:hypothetical protein
VVLAVVVLVVVCLVYVVVDNEEENQRDRVIINEVTCCRTSNELKKKDLACSRKHAQAHNNKRLDERYVLLVYFTFIFSN